MILLRQICRIVDLDPVTGPRYLLFDAVHFPLRRSFDLILFRDVAEQQKIADTLATLDNFLRSNSTYVMMTFWPAGDLTMNRRGLALEAAGWYTPNFLQPPFGFPEPLAMCENDDVGSLHHGQQMLGLWRLSVLRPLVEAARREVPAFYLMLRILAQLYALCIAHGCVVPANNTDGRSWGFILVLVIFSMAVASRRVPL